MRSMFPLLAVFAIIMALMTIAFDRVIERRQNPNTSINLGVEGPKRIVLRRNRNGQYVTPGLINGRKVRFLVDTGADSVAVPAGLAAALGLQRGVPIQAMTAAGPALAHTTHIKEITLGGITLRDIDGAIIPAGADTEILLGMSFLRHLDFQKKGDDLILELGGR